MGVATAIIHSARLVSGGVVTASGWVAFDGRTVLATGSDDSWLVHRGDATSVTDASGRWLSPGFVDIHCHGAGGASFDDGAEAITTALAVHRAHGTTRSVISLVTGTQERLEHGLSVVAALAAEDELVLGSHLEGPFLDREFRGAHDETLLRTADRTSIDRLLAAAAGTLRQVTLAPELPGAAEAIATFTGSGIVVAVGHTAADYEQTLAAFDAGASILTHAFNGMRGIHHRAPGPVAAATHSPGVTLEVINDGVHVHHEVVRIAFASAPRRVALVTDAMAAAGASDGHYILGTLGVTVRDGIARLDLGGSIAGSTLTLDIALRRAVDAGISVADAVAAATEVPAAAIGRGHELGQLAPGYAADAVLLDDDFTVCAVWAAGRQLHSSAG
ncbi:N-acetylglucosamine-6-phosphate deacetylase [Luethyella okanaganae]|uniref:N-acetylglucosamine-6-phosphate deacetylase n=1 Tax=Luethyella okanaganae TaxID=69372 RepID=A0ABW1VK23_9MICO